MSEERTEWQRQWDAENARNARRRRDRPLGRSMWRGLCKRCPRCGHGSLVVQYLKPTSGCPECGEAYDSIRTDDFAPWLTVLMLGHLLMPAAVSLERLVHPPLWVHLVVWVPLGIEMVIVLLPRAKGLALGLMWSLGLRGDEHQY